MVFVETEDYEKRVEVLILAALAVLRMFRGGHNPTETQLEHLDGAILGLIAEKTCGHRITEDCDCV